jgi:hypothetical protein
MHDPLGQRQPESRPLARSSDVASVERLEDEGEIAV